MTLKKLWLIQPIKGTARRKNQTIDQLAFYLIYSKIFERVLYDQMYTYFSNFLPQYQCGFHKGDGAQHCLVAMFGKMKGS